MIWNEHLNLKGLHAELLGASQHSWLNYSEEKLIDRYIGLKAKEKGTEIHELAERLITLNERLPKKQRTLNMYVNDAIGFKMRPEQVLFYSTKCFGTADSIAFRNNLLRIHDLKTGIIPAHMEQLYIYDALFCLEYKYKPGDIKFENRIYQNNEIFIATPDADIILPIMDKIQTFCKIMEKIDEET